MLANCWPSKGQFVMHPPQKLTPPRKTEFYGRSASLPCRWCGAACAGRNSCWLKLRGRIGWLVAVRRLPEVAWSQSVVAWELVRWRAVDFAEWMWTLNRLDGHWWLLVWSCVFLYPAWWAELRLVVAIVSVDWLAQVMLRNELGSECCINMSGGSNVIG
jgi:hypothetical protein